MKSIQSVNVFLEFHPVALGVSRDKKKLGYTVFNTLLEKGIDVLPVIALRLLH